MKSCVSIHAPARGAPQRTLLDLHMYMFQFTRPRGARQVLCNARRYYIGFNSRAREGRDGVYCITLSHRNAEAHSREHCEGMASSTLSGLFIRPASIDLKASCQTNRGQRAFKLSKSNKCALTHMEPTLSANLPEKACRLPVRGSLIPHRTSGASTSIVGFAP